MFKVLYLPEGTILQTKTGGSDGIYKTPQDAWDDLDDLLQGARKSKSPNLAKIRHFHFQVIEVPDV